MVNQRVFLFVNGELRAPQRLKSHIQPGDFLIAVDGGLHHLQQMGLKPDLVIGDLDSISPEDMEYLRSAKIPTQKFPVEKDETDLELAIQAARATGSRWIRIAAALGGRLDQTLGNISLLLDPCLADLDIRLEDGLEEVWLFRRETQIDGQPGDLVSLLPLGQSVPGVETQNLQYPLRAETLYPHKTRGISNVMLTGKASVRIASGSLLCIHTRTSLAPNLPEEPVQK